MALLARIRPTFVAVIAAGLLVTPALAQTAQPSQIAQPSQTTATYENWVLRCVRVGEGGASRVCEIFQQVQAMQNGQAVTLLNVAVGSVASTQPLLVTVGLSPNFTFAGGVRLLTQGGPPADLKFERCVNGLCFASAVLTDALVRELRNAGDEGRIEYQSAAGEPIAVPLSLQGFPQALDALISESRR